MVSICIGLCLEMFRLLKYVILMLKIAHVRPSTGITLYVTNNELSREKR